MTFDRVGLIALVFFAAIGFSGMAGVIIAHFFGPMDEYERAIADQEQLEYLQRWKDEHKTS